MRLPWQAQEYARTCAECGYTWHVPAWARRRPFRTLRMLSKVQVPSDVGSFTDSTDLSRQVESIEAQNQAIDAFRNCPECGADHFTQQAVRGKVP